MKELDDGNVDLIVTSPPYFIPHTDEFMKPALLRGENGIIEDYNTHLETLESIFVECLRVLKPGGFCAINVASTRVKRMLYPLPFDLTVRLIQQGWEFKEEIIWRRWRGWDKRAGVLIQHPYPGYYFPNRVFEFILIFKKPGAPIYQGKSEAEREASRIEIDGLYTKEIAQSIWNILPVLPDEKQGHPCPFPDELAARLIELYSYKGDLVLDPFLGSGTTGKVAHLSGRGFVGYEVNKGFLDLARKRIREPSLQRERHITKYVSLPIPKDSLQGKRR
jgi:modification methylase